MKKLLLLALMISPMFATAQDKSTDEKTTQQNSAPSIPMVSVSAKGSDVRGIIHDLCTQAKKSYVLQPGITFALYLSLDNVEFEEALGIICTQAKLQFELQNGIYFISKAKAPIIAPAMPPVHRGFLPKTVLEKTLTTKLLKSDIHVVFGEFGKQTGVTIEVDKSVPGFKLDAILTKISLKGALDKVTAATGLKYKFTDNLSILVFKPEDPNKVSISN